MDLQNTLPKEPSRIPRKPERPYISSLRSSPMETRRRPLRTYSKRTLSTESVEPPSKRRCLIGPSTSPIQDDKTRRGLAEPEDNTAACVSKPSLPPTKRGTITAYFGKVDAKPLPVALSSDPSSDPASESNESTNTPPSSPPIITTKKRKARRLKTRVVAQHLDDGEGSDEEQGDQDSKKGTGRIRDIEPTTHTRSPALSEATPNTLNQSKSVSKGQSQGGKPRENARQENKAASIQTTLSLSLRETHYTECKECGMLYNHLHETDVKYHTRRHAALRRAKARTDASNNVVE
ncbi:hypothetical protein F4678DRAFT_410051 [Xylaria arbuscula]|nr:hypothetical protein F4678DRAFT_410051 [Xylaria arbuscula]